MTVGEIFTTQKEVNETVLRIPVGDKPEYFMLAINGIIEEASEAKQCDTRWKETSFKRKGYKYHLDQDKKKEELADVFLQLVNACLYSDISASELIDAVSEKIRKNVGRWLSGGHR